MNRTVGVVTLVFAGAMACSGSAPAKPERCLEPAREAEPTNVFVLVQGTCQFMTQCELDGGAETSLEAINGFFAKISNGVPAPTQIGVIDYGGDPTLLAPLGPPAALAAPILGPAAEYNKVIVSALRLGLTQAYRRLRGLPGRKVIVIIGDGQTVNGYLGVERILETVAPFHAAGIELHALGVRSRPGHDREDSRHRLRNLADPDRYREFEEAGDGLALASAFASIVSSP